MTYFFGLTGVGLLIWILQTSPLTTIQQGALFVGALFVNIAGWRHGQEMAQEAQQRLNLASGFEVTNKK